MESFFKLYRTSYFIIIAFSISVTLLLFNNEPISFPLNPILISPDCFQIQLQNLTSNYSEFNFTFSAGEFSQFPQSTAIQMIRIIFQAGNFIQEFAYQQFTNIKISENGRQINFTVRSQISANLVHISAYCQIIPIYKIDINIPYDTKYVEGYSSIQYLDYAIAQFTHSCYLNKSLVFTSPGSIFMDPIGAASNFSINVTSSNLTFYSFGSKTPNLRFDKEPVVFISESPVSAFEQLLYVIIPLYGNVFSDLHTSKHKIILTQNQSWLIPNIKPLIPDSIFPNNYNTCFLKGTILPTPYYPNFLFMEVQKNFSRRKLLNYYINWTLDFNPKIMPQLRSCYTHKTEIKKHKIVLDNNVKNLAKKIIKIIPDAEIVILNETSLLISQIADQLGDAEIFISSHISTFFFGIFLPKGAFLVEIQPDGMECTHYGQKIAKMANANYINVYNSKKCDCLQYTCFFQTKIMYKQISETKIKKILAKILSQESS